MSDMSQFVADYRESEMGYRKRAGGYLWPIVADYRESRLVTGNFLNRIIAISLQASERTRQGHRDVERGITTDVAGRTYSLLPRCRTIHLRRESWWTYLEQFHIKYTCVCWRTIAETEIRAFFAWRSSF